MRNFLKKFSFVFLFGLNLSIASVGYADNSQTPCKDCLPRFDINEYIEQNEQHVCKPESIIEENELEKYRTGTI